MASDFTQKGKYEIAVGNIDLLLDAAIKIMLLDSTYMTNHSKNRNFVDDGTVDDPASHEIAVTGYTGGFAGAGRRVPASRTLNRDDVNARIEFDFADETWTSLGTGATIGAVALIKEITSDALSPFIAVDDVPTDVPTNTGNVIYAPNAEGMLQF